MKKLALAALAALALNLAHAAELEGFKFDDQIKLGNAELVVNGTGVRSKFGKRYAMALYLPAKTADAKAALAAKGAKRVDVRLIKDVSGDTFAGAVSGGINDNSSDAEKAALKDRIKQLADTVSALGEIKAGTAIVFDWVPERGMVLTVGGKPASPSLARISTRPCCASGWARIRRRETSRKPCSASRNNSL